MRSLVFIVPVLALFLFCSSSSLSEEVVDQEQLEVNAGVLVGSQATWANSLAYAQTFTANNTGVLTAVEILAYRSGPLPSSFQAQLQVWTSRFPDPVANPNIPVPATHLGTSIFSGAEIGIDPFGSLTRIDTSNLGVRVTAGESYMLVLPNSLPLHGGYAFSYAQNSQLPNSGLATRGANLVEDFPEFEGWRAYGIRADLTMRIFVDPSDVDQDGLFDIEDNCPNDPNPAQGDSDLDEIGDACDPFPNSGNNEYAQCDADLLVCLAAPVPDADQDTEPDITDLCSTTPIGVGVDSDGCSLDQFCALFPVLENPERKACRKADWRNDEPTMKRRDRDCDIDTGVRGRDDDTCIPAR